jgi:hypothetical protein
MAIRKTQGESEGQGKTKSEILLYMMNTANMCASASKVREHLRTTLNIHEGKGVKTHLSQLESMNVIYPDPNYMNESGGEKYYYLSDIMTVLQYLNSIGYLSDAVCTKYYNSNINTVVGSLDVGFFSRELSDEETESLLIGLKYSPSLLEDMINNKITSETFSLFIKMKGQAYREMYKMGIDLYQDIYNETKKRFKGRDLVLPGVIAATYKLAEDSINRIENKIAECPVPVFINSYIDNDIINRKIPIDVTDTDQFKSDNDRILTLGYSHLNGINKALSLKRA